MRHWSYDPQTARWTQEDPAGLAGGLNLYGFAGGDPTNFSDPFGLRACCTPEEQQQIARMVVQKTAPAKSLIEGIAILAGLKDLAEGVSAVASGHVVAGAFKIALALPLGPGEEARGAEKALQFWHRATFTDEAASAAYHLEKHGGGRALTEYTDDALNFFQQNKGRATSVALKDGTPGLRIRTRGGPGGYFTPDGKIVTFWYK